MNKVSIHPPPSTKYCMLFVVIVMYEEKQLFGQIECLQFQMTLFTKILHNKLHSLVLCSAVFVLLYYTCIVNNIILDHLSMYVTIFKNNL